MSVIYEFLREDGVIVEKFFPMGKCPQQIIDDDGVPANRIFSVVSMNWKEGHESESYIQSRNEKLTAANIKAGERGRDKWRERMPKLVQE